ncbi:3-oxoadipate enol-lactonase [Frigidibacter albus]|uniref:3-oxoadipate enol-lactonase n=1 Tax=Frigidibacter albus TaxID=1465486 RepID=A0A6L8VK22_9RHOB|nr:3-oxoadipate enol-lactonase [Frigidibacter albus]MZQ90553.1 3-oxoadipate enol-lactonase [Frigidibacter albus]NBE32327.1 3-oxoadipate enol-lactonase [Frigidibacter albus]GGH59188.1 3-oxoadipate enol-lactonase [Frigidibacter albus]
MQALTRPFGALHLQVDGPVGAPAVIFANSLGTDLRLWDRVLPLLPQGLRYIRYDKRGHGLSSLGGGAVIDDHAEDAIAVIEEVAGGPVIFVGLSIGGLIGQVVASRRPDLVRAMVLSNTAAKLGTADSWQARIDAVEAGGLDSIADAVMERWFAPAFRATPDLALWCAMMARTPAKGYIAACQALADADQTEATRALRLPVLVIAGSEDGASPAAVVKATADLIPGAAFHEIPGAGHLPCVEAPAEWAALVAPFLKDHSHV